MARGRAGLAGAAIQYGGCGARILAARGRPGAAGVGVPEARLEQAELNEAASEARRRGASGAEAPARAAARLRGEILPASCGLERGLPAQRLRSGERNPH